MTEENVGDKPKIKLCLYRGGKKNAKDSLSLIDLLHYIRLKKSLK